MKLSKDNILTIRMTQREAEQAGLVTCECGHPVNNHFDHGSTPCAHCPCKGYRQTTRIGKFV